MIVAMALSTAWANTGVSLDMNKVPAWQPQIGGTSPGTSFGPKGLYKTRFDASCFGFGS